MNIVVCLGLIVSLSIVHTCATCYSRTTCEGDYFHIACPPAQSIQIEDALFGATRYSRRIRCSISSKTITSKLCNGLNSCTFRVSDELLGNYCSEFKRYLRVKYICRFEEPMIQCNINEVLSPCKHLCPVMCPGDNFTRPQACITLCTGPGCMCKPGCVLDRRSMTCMKPEYCAKIGGQNEEFTLCEADKQIWCPPGELAPSTSTLPPWTCTPGYTCRRGYLRDRFTGQCVLPGDCPIID